MPRPESVTLTALPGIPLIRAGDDLASLILSSLSPAGLALQNQDVIVLGQKIVSKAEGRLRNLAEVTPGEAARRLAAETDKDPRVGGLGLAGGPRGGGARPGRAVAGPR